MVTWMRRTLVTMMCLLVAGCGGGAMAPSPPVNLSGTWFGVLGQGSGGGRALRVAWTATQDGSTASGAVSVLTSPPVTDVIYSAVLTATTASSEVPLTLSARPLPGSACVLSGSGAAAVGTGTLAGSLDVHFTSCG